MYTLSFHGLIFNSFPKITRKSFILRLIFKANIFQLFQIQENREKCLFIFKNCLNLLTERPNHWAES